MASACSVAVIGTGQMGSALAKRLLERGAEVRTALHGRSAASCERIRALGIPFVEDDASLVRGTDLVLSILPSERTLDAAKNIAPALRELARKPAFVECNALAPRAAEEIAELIEGCGCPVIDGGIVGSPPRDGYGGPILFVSGPHAERAFVLRDFGFQVRLAGDRIGDASALKLSYSGISKTISAVGAAMLLAAQRRGIGDVLAASLRETEPNIWEILARRIPRMLPKAGRWVHEMREIADYVEALDSIGGDTYDSIASLFEDIAALQSSHSSGGELDELKRMLAAEPPVMPKTDRT